jgi:hypothetical protein
MMRAATNRTRAARAMVTVMRVVGDEESRDSKAHGIGDKGACKEEGNGNGGKSAGNEGGE